MWEGGLASTLVMGLNRGLEPEEEVSKKKNTLMDYLVSHIKVNMIIMISSLSNYIFKSIKILVKNI